MKIYIPFLFPSAPNHYHLAMHSLGALTTASTLQELDDLVQSVAVVFSSPCSGQNVEKHFKNLQLWLQKTKIDLDVNAKSKSKTEDLKVNVKSGFIITCLHLHRNIKLC